MNEYPALHLVARKQRINFCDGFRCWETLEENIQCATMKTAFIIVDMWDKHWSAGHTRRSGWLAVKIDEAAKRARERGILVVHAPSDTESFYKGQPVRNRLLIPPPPHKYRLYSFLQLLNKYFRVSVGATTSTIRPTAIPEPVTIMDYPLPIDDSDGGSESVDEYPPNTRVWTRQNAVIGIDQYRDVLCGDEGDILFSYLRGRGIQTLIYTGVASNGCILNRSFGIKNMLRRGMQTFLVRDLTDAIYNPERPPYVTHEEGAALVTAYIEKFYCPTIDSGQL